MAGERSDQRQQHNDLSLGTSNNPIDLATANHSSIPWPTRYDPNTIARSILIAARLPIPTSSRHARDILRARRAPIPPTSRRQARNNRSLGTANNPVDVTTSNDGSHPRPIQYNAQTIAGDILRAAGSIADTSQSAAAAAPLGHSHANHGRGGRHGPTRKIACEHCHSWKMTCDRDPQETDCRRCLQSDRECRWPCCSGPTTVPSSQQAATVGNDQTRQQATSDAQTPSTYPATSSQAIGPAPLEHPVPAIAPTTTTQQDDDPDDVDYMDFGDFPPARSQQSQHPRSSAMGRRY